MFSVSRQFPQFVGLSRQFRGKQKTGLDIQAGDDSDGVWLYAVLYCVCEAWATEALCQQMAKGLIIILSIALTPQPLCLTIFLESCVWCILP